MTKEQAETLVEYDPTGEIDHRPQYSGRGMYGDTTHAVVLPSVNDFHLIVSEVMKNGTEEEQVTISELLANGIRTDNMGLDMIIY